MLQFLARPVNYGSQTPPSPLAQSIVSCYLACLLAKVTQKLLTDDMPQPYDSDTTALDFSAAWNTGSRSFWSSTFFWACERNSRSFLTKQLAAQFCPPSSRMHVLRQVKYAIVVFTHALKTSERTRARATLARICNYTRGMQGIVGRA